jgi:DNA polymerase III delta prime subunit
VELQWIDKYSPSTIDDMVLDTSIKNMLNGYVKNDNMCNLLLSGKQGIGKTTLAKAIIKELNATKLYINASSENGIDTVRNKITEFSECIGYDGRIKIVLLDEADGLTSQAQNSLRNVIQECSDDTRFIFTCNYLHKIIDPIQSRCTPLPLKFDIKLVAKHCIQILQSENIKFEEHKADVLSIIKKNYPDIRACISVLQQSFSTGKFVNVAESNVSELRTVATTIISMLNDPFKARQYWIGKELQFNNDYIALSHEMFNVIDNAKAMVIIGDSLARQPHVVDKEVEFSTCMFKIHDLLRK